MPEKLAEYVRLARLDHGFLAALAALTGMVSATGSTGSLLTCAACLVVATVVLAEAGIFAANDIFNIEEDRVNAPHRPLVKGTVSLGEAKAFSAVCVVLSLILTIPLGVSALAIVAVAIAISMLYNAGLKRYGPLGNFIVSFSTALPFLYGSVVAVGSFNTPPRIALFTAIAFLATYGREIVKGIADVEGDAKAGVKTLPLIIGVERSALVAAAFMLAAVLLSVAAVPSTVSPLLYIITVLPVDVLFAYCSASIVIEPRPATALKVRRVSLWGMLLGILSFLAGSLNL